MLVDLTLRLEEGMVFRLGTPPVRIRSEQFFHADEGGEYQSTTLFMPLHTATHVDVVNKENRVEIGRLIGPGKLFDVTGITEREIAVDDCINQAEIEPGDFVFFKTGWTRYLETERYYVHPELSRELLEWLIKKQINMAGIDALGLGRGKKHGAYDRLLVKNGIYVIENLANLDSITGSAFKVYCFPLSIEETDALPARVLAEL
jgi:kynurenine formamidase